MNAIVPLNIAALRVNYNDYTNVVSGFQGLTASFDQMPWYNPNGGQPPAQASTGDKIYRALGTANGNPLRSPINPLRTGIHLQWELPDYFRKGTQPADGGRIVFPPAPNRWLVTRFLSMYDAQSGTYGEVSSKRWIVESDYLTPGLEPGPDGLVRAAISVPIPPQPGFQEQPYMYMGRVVDYEDWDPNDESPSDYLPAYTGPDGAPLYLTSVGFVGAYFGSYYPECCSVFGFWDNFSDVAYSGYDNLYDALQNNAPVQFRASYQVSGWLNDPTQDPLAGLDATITEQYTDYLHQCDENGVDPELNPNDFFRQLTVGDMHWAFNLDDVGYTLNPDDSIKTLDYPQETLSAGTSQEVVWNMTQNPGTTYFLKSNDGDNPSCWQSEVEIAVGNSTEEAIAAILKRDMGQNTNDDNLLDNYEYLLDALQLGLLADLESTPNKLIALEESLHDNGFSDLPGGYVWIVGSQKVDSDQPVNPNSEVTLPLDLAEQLHLLNAAQKAYDLGRDALDTMRKQLFQDWTHYVKLYVGEIDDPNISLSDMTNFIATSSSGELKDVVDQGTAVGLLNYVTDGDSGAISGMVKPVRGVKKKSLAYAVWNQYQVVAAALEDQPGWQLQCAKAEAFHEPKEPLVLLQGDMLEPVARNGKADAVFVRLSPELLNEITVTYQDTPTQLAVSDLAGVPAVSSVTPMQADVQALLGEAFLLTPLLAEEVGDALKALGGQNNPAVDSLTDFVISLMYAQGGLSPLDLDPNPGGVPAPPTSSLFATVAADDYVPAANPSISVDSPQALAIEFTNGAANGWPPDHVGWTTQATPSGFPSTQVNPFLPIFMIWTVELDPLRQVGTDGQGNPAYAAKNLTDFFTLDADAVDYVYKVEGGQGVDFTSGQITPYGDSSTMTANSANVLLYQINSYLGNHPNDPEKDTLAAIATEYGKNKFLAQSIGGFNIQQILSTPIAQVAVEDLTKGSRDAVTTQVAAAATAVDWDNWYDYAFNSLTPISTGLLAQQNFGPLRSGFLAIDRVELVDAFGQRMDLFTAKTNPDNSLQVITSYAMTPPADDTQNQDKIYLAPRLLTPTRLWFHWLSATFDPSVEGITGDFAELTGHPATSPVCGWVLPNHLDNDLFFYNSDGAAIGTFGTEGAGTSAALVYRTRAGNLISPSSGPEALAQDIGPEGDPQAGINPNLANYMWYLQGQNAAYLEDLLAVILGSADFINPANYAQNAALSVLIGRPLALARVEVGLETAGNLLPISQADNDAQSPFPQDVNAGRTAYTERMAYSAAQLQDVNFPLRLGDLANLDDGLVGYLIEGSGDNPLTGENFYAPAATSSMTGGVQAPSETTLQLKLNDAVQHLTLLLDPRAPVHATTGILPVSSLRIPNDQYAAAMGRLAVNFITRPLLKMAQGLRVPLPAEAGYSWSWITPGTDPPTPLQPNQVNDTPIYGYTSQTLEEGWLQLSPDPDDE
ncbi:MAG: hypothetical protein AAF998_13680 [Bacteroidota bacterium]